MFYFKSLPFIGKLSTSLSLSSPPLELRADPPPPVLRVYMLFLRIRPEISNGQYWSLWYDVKFILSKKKLQQFKYAVNEYDHRHISDLQLYNHVKSCQYLERKWEMREIWTRSLRVTLHIMNYARDALPPELSSGTAARGANQGLNKCSWLIRQLNRSHVILFRCQCGGSDHRVSTR